MCMYQYIFLKLTKIYSTVMLKKRQIKLSLLSFYCCCTCKTKDFIQTKKMTRTYIICTCRKNINFIPEHNNNNNNNNNNDIEVPCNVSNKKGA